MSDYSWNSNPLVWALTFRRVNEPPSGKPILFSGAMVRAILRAENPKTQTRRVIVPQYGWGDWRKCPYGDPGDRLYVRETWQAYRTLTVAEQARQSEVLGRFFDGQVAPEQMVDAALSLPVGSGDHKPLYAADFGDWAFDADSDLKPWRPSIHMPKWASRITLEITEVRVQRVQEISEEDAMAEGAPETCDHCANAPEAEVHWACEVDYEPEIGHRVGFRRLWDSINAARGPKRVKVAA